MRTVRPGNRRRRGPWAKDAASVRRTACHHRRQRSVAAHSLGRPRPRDVRLYAGLREAGTTVCHRPATGRGTWIQVVGGTLDVNGKTLGGGDGAAIEHTGTIVMTARDLAEVLLFDLD